MEFTGAGTEDPTITAVPSGPNNVPDKTPGAGDRVPHTEVQY
jgi:hypothetical protein